MAAGLDDFWARARDQVDSHRAVHIVQMIRPDLMAANICRGLPLDEFPVKWTQRRLQDVAHTQNARWDMPLDTLARLVVATINGIISAVVERDPGAAEVATTSELFAHYLSQHGIRNRLPGIARSTP
jgi:phage tail protein X